MDLEDLIPHPSHSLLSTHYPGKQGKSYSPAPTVEHTGWLNFILKRFLSVPPAMDTCATYLIFWSIFIGAILFKEKYYLLSIGPLT